MMLVGDVFMFFFYDNVFKFIDCLNFMMGTVGYLTIASK